MALHRLGFPDAAAATQRTEELHNAAAEVTQADLGVQDAAAEPGPTVPVCVGALDGAKGVYRAVVCNVPGAELRIHLREAGTPWRGLFATFDLLCEA